MLTTSAMSCSVELMEGTVGSSTLSEIGNGFVFIYLSEEILPAHCGSRVIKRISYSGCIYFLHEKVQMFVCLMSAQLQ